MKQLVYRWRRVLLTGALLAVPVAAFAAGSGGILSVLRINRTTRALPKEKTA